MSKLKSRFLKTAPFLFLVFSFPLPSTGGISISSPVITEHADLDGLTTGDDHTQYQQESEKDQANGYAGLDGSGDLPASALPNHAANHTDGTDDLQSATAGQKGLATATQITKLDAIETGATADQSDAEIKTAYENNADTNAFTDTEQLKLSELSNEIGGGHNSSIWRSDTAGIVAPPTDRRMRWNNATQSSSTELFIDDDNGNGIDVSAFFATLANGSLIRVQLVSDASVVQVFEVTSSTDNTTFFTFGVTNETGIGGNIANNRDIILTFITSNDIAKHASTHQTAGDDSIPIVTVGVDGLMSAADKTKIDAIESGATGDQTAGEIKTAYESNADTNEFDDTEQSKLAGIETSATADQTDAEIKTAYENNANTNEFDDTEQTKLTGIETGATADQTNGEIKTAYEANANTNEFDDTEQSKLAGIETAATADQTNGEIKTAYEVNANTNEFDDTEQSKLAGIETAATADQTDAEIKTAYENNANTNEFDDTEQTKLAGISETWHQFLGPENAALENFNGSPDVKAAGWVSVDLESYSDVIGTIASDKGGLVFQFVVPPGATDLTEVECTGKVGVVAAGNQIVYRVKREDGTQVDTGGPHVITAGTETDLSITTFSGETLVAGTRIFVEAQGDVDVAETVSIGSCRIEFAR